MGVVEGKNKGYRFYVPDFSELEKKLLAHLEAQEQYVRRNLKRSEGKQ